MDVKSIEKFINSEEWFDGYDTMIERRTSTNNEISAQYDNWFKFVNRPLSDIDFRTDIKSFIKSTENKNINETSTIKDTMIRLLDSSRTINTKDIGDYGESIIFNHECKKLEQGEREDLIRLVKRIPTQLAVGYDIQSIDLDETKKYIEVKTTISSKPLHFYKIHLTRNEWNAAKTLSSNYFIYRLMISKDEQKLFIIQDPIGKYKRDILDIIPTEGADLSFKTSSQTGEFERLLPWED